MIIMSLENKELIKINKLFTNKSKDLSNNEINYNKLKSKIESLVKEIEYKTITFNSNKNRIKENIKILKKSSFDLYKY